MRIVDDSTIERSFALGKVDGNEFVGGLTGLNCDSGDINNCYALGPVVGNNYVGLPGRV